MTRIATGPVRWKDGAGRWRDFDLMLRLGDEQPGYEVSAGPAQVMLPSSLGDGAAGGASISTADGSVRTWVEGANAPATARDEVATYDEALPGVAVKMRAVPEGLKEDLILADRFASSAFSYRVRLSDGLGARLARGGEIEILRGARVAFVIPAPVAVDAAAAPATAPAPQYALRRLDGGDYRLSFALDREWLRADERVWPVTVDPTILPYSSTTGWSCSQSLTAVLVGNLAQNYVRSSPDCNNPNVPLHEVGGWVGSEGSEYQEAGASIDFGDVTELLSPTKRVTSARAIFYKDSELPGQTSGLRLTAGDSYDDVWKTATVDDPAARASFEFDVTEIAWSWHEHIYDVRKGYPQGPLTLTEDAPASLLLQSQAMGETQSYECMYGGEDILCARGWTTIASSSNPDFSKRPVLEIAQGTISPRLEVDDWASWRAGRVTIVNRGEYRADLVRAEILDGDLAWADMPDADKCSGNSLPAQSGSCELALIGNSGTVRLWDGDEITDVDVRLTAYPPTPPELPSRADRPFLQPDIAAGDFPLVIKNVGAQTAEIEGVEIVHGNLQWAGSESDNCTLATVVVRDSGCELRLSGDIGILRFELADGHTQDVLIDLAALAPEEPAETPVDDWPLVSTYHRLSNPTTWNDLVWAPAPVIATGIFDFTVMAWDRQGVKSISATIDGRPLGTYTNALYRGCTRTDGSNCLDDCATILYLDPSRTCVGWWYSLYPSDAAYRPNGADARFRFDSSGFRDGLHTIRTVVTDHPPGLPAVNGHVVTQEWKFVIDNNPPFMAISGGLYESRDQDRITTGRLTVVAGDDGSGVTAIDLLDTTTGADSRLGSRSRTCDVYCERRDFTGEFEIDPLDPTLRWGNDETRRLRVDVHDAAGFVARMNWNVTFYKAAWMYGNLDEQSDFDTLRNDLWTKPNYDEIWNLLRQADKNKILADSYNSLIRERSTAAVYYIGRGARYWVQSLEHFGINPATVHVLPDGALGSLSRGADITTAARLFRMDGDAGVYYVSRGQRFLVASVEVATTYGLDLSRTQIVPQGFLDLVPRGNDITATDPGVLVLDGVVGAPVITLSGDLVNHAGDGQMPARPTLFLSASQPVGVKRMRLLFDGTEIQTYLYSASPCSTPSCVRRDEVWVADRSKFVGDDVVRVEAWDYLDRYSVQNLRVITAAPESTDDGWTEPPEWADHQPPGWYWKDWGRGSPLPPAQASGGVSPYCPKNSDITLLSQYGTFQTHFHIHLKQVGYNRAGQLFYQYFVHYQVRRPWRTNVAWTRLQLRWKAPDGSNRKHTDNSYDKRDRPDWRPYYAHQTVMTQPNSLLRWDGKYIFNTPFETVIAPGVTELDYGGGMGDSCRTNAFLGM
ncbi:hypothetical protein [Conexibacter sp. CPCC 206217]|uniref:hypothetical protein n=1 Tax=Conexibacter sp. CPCC 206217 TaxID=3064574 RepID=UPI00271597BC|nr:hypothetical protein [Conexibacter sp. CPCC 206217]MDO8210764.1 hypothetical protein [Conexibacter sp. CPCC 206217]